MIHQVRKNLTSYKVECCLMLQREEITLTKQISRNAIYGDRGPECIICTVCTNIMYLLGIFQCKSGKIQSIKFVVSVLEIAKYFAFSE